MRVELLVKARVEIQRGLVGSTTKMIPAVFDAATPFESHATTEVETYVNALLLSLHQDPRLLPLQLWLQPLEHHQHPPTRHLLSRGQEGNTHTNTHTCLTHIPRKSRKGVSL